MVSSQGARSKVTLTHDEELSEKTESTEMNEQEYADMKAHYSNLGNPNFGRLLGKILRQKIYDKKLDEEEERN